MNIATLGDQTTFCFSLLSSCTIEGKHSYFFCVSDHMMAMRMINQAHAQGRKAKVHVFDLESGTRSGYKESHSTSGLLL